MGTRMKDLKSRLDIGSGGVRMVRIRGVGGGGKTTLASAAYLEISRYFESYCLDENIQEESSKLDLKKLQEELLVAVLKKPVVVQSSEEGKYMIKSRLCHRKVLVVLDDVNGNYQLDTLARSHDWFCEGSQIIITTRDEHLLKAHKVDMIYGVSLLSRDESTHLFYIHAYREHKPVKDYEILSRDVISYDTAGVEFGQNRKNHYFGPLVDTEKSHETPRSYHNKKNSAIHVDNNYHYSFDCSSDPAHRQAETVVDNHYHNVNYSRITCISKSRTEVVEDD
nr:TMV resistance protein N-like [Tanacetum cinerariifolium]